MAQEKVYVRVMHKEDVPHLVEIDAMASGTARASYLQGKAQQALDSRHSLVAAMVAESEGQVVGFLMGQVYRGEFGISETVATVDTVGIHPESQCEGVARALMDEYVAHARKLGVERVHTLVDWNQWDLMGFFRALGFAPGSAMVLARKV